MRTASAQLWAKAAAATILAVGLVAAGSATADLLSSLFPEGVPGYGAEPGVTVLSRARPAYDPLGLHAGAFTLWPQLQEAIGYDSNVLAGAHPRGSWTVGTRPSLLTTGTWSAGSVGAYLSLDDNRYMTLPSQGRTDGSASLGGTLAVGSDSLTLGVAHVVQHQDRSQLDALPSDRPIRVRIEDGRLSYALTAGRFTVTPSAEVSQWTYGDTTILGLPSSQAYRDHLVLQGGVTLRYDWQPLRSMLVVLRATGQRYTDQPPGQMSENSTGYQALVGFDYDDNAVWRYRLLLGAETRRFAAFHPHTDFIAEGEASWSPSGLTTISASITRSIEDAAQEGVAGYTYTAARLSVNHEYLRNLLLNASAGAQRADFLQGSGMQTGYRAGVGVTWLMNRSMRLSATYDISGITGTHGASTLATGDFARQVTLLTLRLGL
jgi:hypothetical protein